jgi:hypothetical protein
MARNFSHSQSPKRRHLLVFDTSALLSANEKDRVQVWRNYEQLGECYVPGVTYAEISTLSSNSKKPKEQVKAKEFLKFVSSGCRYKIQPTENRSIPIDNQKDRQIIACAHRLSNENPDAVIILVTYDLTLQGLVQQSGLPNFCTLEASKLATWFHEDYKRDRVPQEVFDTYNKMKFKKLLDEPRSNDRRLSGGGDLPRKPRKVIPSISRGMKNAEPPQDTPTIRESYKLPTSSRSYENHNTRIKFDDYITSLRRLLRRLITSESVSSVQNLKRYPNLDCPDKQILNQMYGLEVSLLLDKPEGESPEAMIIRDTGTSELPELEIWLTAEGFDLVSGSVKKIKVKRNDLSKVWFTLIPRRLGENKVKAEFFQYDELIGSISRNILVSEEIIEQTVSQPNQTPSIPVKTALTIPPQDLDLLIDLDRDRRTLRFRLNSWKKEINLGFSDCGRVTLEGSPLEKMQSVYKEMTEMAKKIPLTLEDKRQAEERLDAVGNKLWDELTPEIFKQAYWKFKSRVKSILITSEEPWIPWEMLKPYRYDDNGEQENDSFWCQQFAMSRWLSGGGTADELDITSSRTISPTKSNLPSTEEEIAFLNQLSSLRPNIIPLASFSTKRQVLDSLQNEELSILHFACHGMFDSTSPNDSAIMLSDAPLRPSDIRVAFGTNKKPQRPLIFLNACYGGQAEFGFTGLGGWAERFVKANAGAFVGAMWEVTDRLALQFAKAFYSALLRDNQSIAESFRQAREEIRQLAPYNSTWLAYTLYADPEGRVKDNE